MSIPSPTQHVHVQLLKQDGTTQEFPSVEFFTRRCMVWIRYHSFEKESLTGVVIDGVKYSIRDLENKPTYCEILLEPDGVADIPPKNVLKSIQADALDQISAKPNAILPEDRGLGNAITTSGE